MAARGRLGHLAALALTIRVVGAAGQGGRLPASYAAAAADPRFQGLAGVPAQPTVEGELHLLVVWDTASDTTELLQNLGLPSTSIIEDVVNVVAKGSDTIAAVKQMIQTQAENPAALPPQQMRLLSEWTTAAVGVDDDDYLEDHRTLADYGIKWGAKLFLRFLDEETSREDIRARNLTSRQARNAKMLSYSAALGNLSAVKLLLEGGLDPNVMVETKPSEPAWIGPDDTAAPGPYKVREGEGEGEGEGGREMEMERGQPLRARSRIFAPPHPAIPLARCCCACVARRLPGVVLLRKFPGACVGLRCATFAPALLCPALGRVKCAPVGLADERADEGDPQQRARNCRGPQPNTAPKRWPTLSNVYLQASLWLRAPKQLTGRAAPSGTPRKRTSP